ERARVAVAPEVELERFELDDRLVRHVRDRDRGVVGLAGPRADARELGRLAADLVVTPRMRVGDGLERTRRAAGHRHDASGATATAGSACGSAWRVAPGSELILGEHPVHLGDGDRAGALVRTAAVCLRTIVCVEHYSVT